MSLLIQYKAQLKALSGIAEESIANLSENATLSDILDQIIHKHAALGSVLMKDGIRNPSIMIFLNQKQVSASDNPLVNEHDRLMLMSPIAGG